MLTNVDYKIRDYIVEYIKQHGYSPSIREIAEDMEYKSISCVQGHLQKMLKHGLIETDTGIGSPRAIRVPGYRFEKIPEEENIKEKE